MITLIYFNSQQKDSRYDPKKRKWVSYRLDVQIAGKRYRNRFARKSDAEEFVDRLRSESRAAKAGISASPSNDTDVRVSDLFEARLAHISERREYIKASRVFKVFQNLLEFDLPVTRVTRAHFKAYIRSREGVSNATINREISCLSGAFSAASALFPESLAEYEPIKGVRLPKAKGRAYNHVITPSEKDAIVDALLNGRLPYEHLARKRSRQGFARMFEFAWLLGLRFSEALNLRRSDYIDVSQTLVVYRSKTDTYTPIKFLPERAIEIIQEKSGDDPLFDIYCTERTLQKMLRDACKDAKVPYGRCKGVTFHSTRHSFTTRLVQVTDIATAASFTGHSDKAMVAYYSHASDASKQKAMQAMYGTSDLKEIFERVKDGRMKYEEFAALVAGKG